MPLATPSGGIEELVDETSGREVVLTPQLVDRFEELTKKYEYFLVVDEEEWSMNNVQDILLPCDINLFLQTTRCYENHINYHLTGFFISQLLQNSYKAGNNEFELDMASLNIIHNLASDLSGTEERMIRVVITGEAGDLCGYKAQYSTFTVEKAGDWCGEHAEHSIFTIGKVGNWCGSKAQHSTFTVEKAGDWCGLYSKYSTFTIKQARQGCGRSAQDSTFTIEKAGEWCGGESQHSIFTLGEVGDECGYEAHNSVFKTSDEASCEQLKSSVPRRKGNKIYLVSADGSLNKVKW